MGHRLPFSSRRAYDGIKEHTGRNRRLMNLENQKLSISNERQVLFQKSMSHPNGQQQFVKPWQMNNNAGHLQPFEQNSLLPNTGLQQQISMVSNNEQHNQLQQSPVLSNRGQQHNQLQHSTMSNTSQQYYQFQGNSVLANTEQHYNLFQQSSVFSNTGQQPEQLQNPVLVNTEQNYNQLPQGQVLGNTGQQYNVALHNSGQQYNKLLQNPVLPNTGQHFQPNPVLSISGQQNFQPNPVLPNTGQQNFQQNLVLPNTGQQHFQQNPVLPISGQQNFQQNPVLPNTEQHFQQNTVMPNTGQQNFQQNPVLTDNRPQYNQFQQNLALPNTGQQHSQLQQNPVLSNTSHQSNIIQQNQMLRFEKQSQFQNPVFSNDIRNNQFQNEKLMKGTEQPQQFPVLGQHQSPIRSQRSPVSNNVEQFFNQQSSKFNFGQSSQFQSGPAQGWNNGQQPLFSNGSQNQFQPQMMSNDLQHRKFQSLPVLNSGMQQSSFQPPSMLNEPPPLPFQPPSMLRNEPPPSPFQPPSMLRNEPPPSPFQPSLMLGNSLQQSKLQPLSMLDNGLQQTKFQQRFNQQSNFKYSDRSLFSNTKEFDFRQKYPTGTGSSNYQNRYRQRELSLSPMKSNTSGFQNGRQLPRNQNSTPPFSFTLPHNYKSRFNFSSGQQNNNVNGRYKNGNNFQPKSQYNQQQSKRNFKEMSFSCDTCDRAFAQENELKRHLDEHIKCGIKGCKFEAHFKIVGLHRKMQHDTGYADAISKLDDDEEIEKWRNARRSRFPTAENIKKKKAEQSEREARGEVIETKDFGKFQKHQNERNNVSQRRSRGRGQRNGFRSRRTHAANKRVFSESSKEANIVTVDESDSDDDSYIKLPRFKGLLSVANQESSFNGKNESEVSTIIETEKPSSLTKDTEDVEKNTQFSLEDINNKKTKTEQQKSLQMNGANTSVSDEDCVDLSSSNELQIVNLDSDDAPTIEPIQKASLIKEAGMVPENKKGSPNKEQEIEIEDSADEGPTVVPICKSVLNDSIMDKEMASKLSPSKERAVEVKNHPNKRKESCGGSSGKEGGNSYKRQRFGQRQWNSSHFPPPKSTLLEKLLADDIRHERNVILQCVRHIVKNNFFDK